MLMMSAAAPLPGGGQLLPPLEGDLSGRATHRLLAWCGERHSKCLVSVLLP
jgi:hypothetical protein